MRYSAAAEAADIQKGLKICRTLKESVGSGGIPSSPFMARKRLRSETYYPAFNSNELFCRSKFRDKANR